MNEQDVNRYARLADRMDRDPIVTPGEHGRADVANGQRFATWVRFHSAADLTWVETIDGRMVGLTPWQLRVYLAVRDHIDKGHIKMREIAVGLGCSASTVSRAMVKLMSWGLLGYISGRGRYGGTIIFGMVKGDGFQRFRDAAKAKVRKWAEASQRRISRLRGYVAPYVLEEGRGYDSLTSYVLDTSTHKGATIELEWTPEALRDAGII